MARVYEYSEGQHMIGDWARAINDKKVLGWNED